MKRREKGILAASFSALFLASYVILGKLLLQDLPPITLIATTQITSVVFLLLFFGLAPELKRLKKLSIAQWMWVVIIALLSGVAAPLLAVTGLRDTFAVNAVMLGRLEVVATSFIAILWLKEKMSRFQIFGVVLMILGVGLVSTQGFRVGLDFSGGDIFVIGAALIWAFSNVLFRPFLRHLKPEIIVLMRNIMGGITFTLLLPLGSGFQHDFSALSSTQIFLMIAAFSVFSIILAQFLWYRSLELISTTLASSISLLAPVFGVILAIVVLREGFFMYHLWGGLLVVLGLIFTVIHRHRHPQEHHGFWQRLKHRFF